MGSGDVVGEARDGVVPPELSGRVCHCGLTGLSRDELDQHMQKAHGAPAFGTEPVMSGNVFVDSAAPRQPYGIESPAAIEALGLNTPCRAATLDAFVTAARSLKAAEDALVAARQAYAEAVKALSEEAVR